MTISVVNCPGLLTRCLIYEAKRFSKDNFARALCCALPKFDLVIVDEGHNLKHGFP